MTSLATVGAGPKLGSVKLVNRAPHKRSDVVTTVLPFAQGVYFGGPLSIEGERDVVVAEPFGQRWPDGSWRYVRVAFRATVEASETTTRGVVGEIGDPTSFSFSPAMLAQMDDSVFSSKIVVGGNEVSFGHPWQQVHFDSALLFRIRKTVRVPNTTLWAEMEIEFRSWMDHAGFTLRIGDSDPRDSEVTHKYPEIQWHHRGCEPVIWHGQCKQLARTGDYKQGFRMTLDKGGVWGDGQELRLQGVLLAIDNVADQETLKAERLGLPIFAASTDWAESGAWFPWGDVAAMPWLDENTANHRAARDYNAHTAGDPWTQAVLGCMPDPQGTGDQRDFGSSPMHAELNGFLDRLYCLNLDALQEGCRPTHKRYADGRRVRFQDHPKALIWNGVIDNRITPAGEMMGKSGTVTTSQVRKTRGLSWYGHGREHWTVNHLVGYYLMTGDRLAGEEIDHQIGLWLNGCTISSASSVLNQKGADRDVGRTLQTGVLLLLATGDPQLEQRIRERVDVVRRQWTGRNTHPHRPGTARGPDARNLGGELPFTMEWQMGIGARGLDAVWQVLGDQTARDLASLWARDVLDFGIFQKSGQLVSAKATEWKGGAWAGWKEWYKGYNETENAVEFYHGYLLWMLPAALICRREGYQIGKCDQIVGQLGLPGTKNERTIEWAAMGPPVLASVAVS